MLLVAGLCPADMVTCECYTLVGSYQAHGSGMIPVIHSWWYLGEECRELSDPARAHGVVSEPRLARR